MALGKSPWISSITKFFVIVALLSTGFLYANIRTVTLNKFTIKKGDKFFIKANIDGPYNGLIHKIVKAAAVDPDIKIRLHLVVPNSNIKHLSFSPNRLNRWASRQKIPPIIFLNNQTKIYTDFITGPLSKGFYIVKKNNEIIYLKKYGYSKTA